MQAVTAPEPQPEDITREHLWEAWMAELLCSPSSAEASALVSELLTLTLAFEAEHHPRKQKWRANDLATFRIAMGALLADLLTHANNAEAQGSMWRLKDRADFTDTLCSSRHFERLELYWSEMGWIETFKGFRKYDGFMGVRAFDFGKALRLRATKALLALAEKHRITPTNASDHFSRDHRKSSPVEVKGRSFRGKDGRKTSKRISPRKTPKFLLAREQIRELNRFLEGHSFSLEEVPRFKRTFNNGDAQGFDCDQGGRLYCVSKDNYQGRPKAQRLDLLIDGEPCAEIDVSSSFLAIYHWSCGVHFDPSKDLYAVEGVERSVVKKIVVARLGSEDWPEHWPKGFKTEYRKETGRELTKVYKLGDVVSAVKKKLPILSDIDQSRNGWAQLQYWESEAVLGAILELKDRYGVVALPIHDSLLVSRSHAERAKEVLQESYRTKFGFIPKVTVSGMEL